MSTNKSLAKSAGVIGAATTCSRILGFLRDIIIARLFGTARYAQAFVVAFRLPNLLRDLVGEGATNAAFVPVLSEYITKRSKEEYWALANVILNLLLVVLMAITILGIAFAPAIVRLIAPGFINAPEKLAITIRLARFIFPYILLIGLTAYCMGILNSLKHFALPAFGPCMLNISLIVAALVLCPKMGVKGLAVGVLLGGALQLGIQIPMLYKKGFRVSPFRLRVPPLHHPAVKKIGTLLLPRALGAAVYQINVLVDTILASLAHIVGAGGVAALYYSNRIIQFPLAIFGIAMATAALPTMSAQAAEKDVDRLKGTLSFSLRSVFFITIPAALGLMVLAGPIVRLLFERGAFDAYSTQITSFALFFYAFGLFAYAGIKILVSCFYSLQDTLTPVKVASFSLVLNLILNLILMWPLKVGGLALATAISASVNFVILFFILRRRIGNLDGKRIACSSIRILCASLVMGACCWLMLNRFNYSYWFSLRWVELMQVAIPIISSIAVFLIACFIFRVGELRSVSTWISKRK